MTEKIDPVEALRDLIKSYEALVLAARDRIIDLGGDCDPAARMIADDPALLEARSALAAAEAAGMVMIEAASLEKPRAGEVDALRQELGLPPDVTLTSVVREMKGEIARLVQALRDQTLEKVEAQQEEAMSDQEISDAWAIADGDLDFTPPLRFEFAQGSDQTGEYYTSVARFVDANGKTIMDITYDGDWVDTQMHAIAAVLSIARRRLLAAQEKP